MENSSTDRIRTLALVGQAGCGKTSLAEALLAQARAIPTPGSVERGTTVCDYTALEKSARHSLKLAVASFETKDARIHLLDTPGYPDFLGHSLPALAAVETAAVVINAQNGLEMMTGRFMHWAARRGLDRLIVVNKIDAATDLEGLLERIRQAFGKECLPINLPAGGAARVSDCFFAPSGEADFSSVEEAHKQLVDQVVEIDEELMALYLEKGSVEPEQLHAPLERALREGHLVPVVFASAKTGAGIAELLQVIVKLMPSPAEGNPPVYVKTPAEGGAAAEIRAEADPSKHVLAHVFKIEIDPYVGRLAAFRVHQGRVTPGTQLFIGDGRKPIKAGHLYMLRGKQQIEVAEALPGDICAIAKIDEIRFDHILHDAPEDANIHARPLELPQSIFGLAVQPRKRGEEQKVSDVLHRLIAEDPCFRVEYNAQANETVMRGLGEMHLRTTLEKIAGQYKLELDTRPPSVAFRETVTARADGHSRHKKQTGGAGQFGEVFLRVEPLARGAGFEFVDAVKGGVIPTVYIPAVEKGVRAVLDSGYLAGYPLQDLRVVVYDGKSHPVDSKEVAFIAAGRKAFLDALAKARPIILEPIVDIDVALPESNMGDIAGDLSARRGHIKGSEAPRPGALRLAAQAPLSELESFPTRLKALTAGQGSYTLEFSHYEPAPAPLQQKLVAQHKPATAEEP
ncbi:MAG TPA: elongation factor G [Burkholderiales bacterium]|nr:elongation factor G [Burkholderiales bacterium]